MDLLIADDSSLIRKLLVQLTVKHGYRPKVFNDGVELWDYLSELSSKAQFMAVVDWEMPGYEGPELCQKIRQRFTENPPYVLILTGRGGLKDVVSGLRSGANDYVTKPFQDEELLARLEVGQRTLDMQRQLSQMSEQLLQAEKMGSVGRLAAGAAHELNNPIGFVKSNVETLRQYIADLLSLTDLLQGETLDKAAIETRLEALDIDFLKTDTTELFDETLLGIDRVRQIVSSLEQFAHEKSNEHTSCRPMELVPSRLDEARDYRVDLADLPPVSGDLIQLQRLFDCLLDNALFATRDGGAIRVRGRVKGNVLEIDVADSGTGIPDSVIKHVFDPFYTSKQIGEGTGLGLTAAFNIVQRHGGNIRVKSTEGKGAIFTVSLPLASRNPS